MNNSNGSAEALGAVLMIAVIAAMIYLYVRVFSECLDSHSLLYCLVSL